MRYSDLARGPLTEAITNTLYTQAWKALADRVAAWGKANYQSAIDALGLTEQDAEVAALGRHVSGLWKADDWKAADKFSDRLSNMRSDLADAFERGLRDQQFGLEDLKAELEVTLQTLAREHIEQVLGPIDPFVRGVDYDAQKDKHLYWLQHIVVHLRTNGVSKKTGRPLTGGGYFQRSPSATDFTTRYTLDNVDWHKDLGVGVMINLDPRLLIDTIRDLLVGMMHERHYGENMVEGNRLATLLTDILDVYVHEVVHLEQDARRSLNKRWSRAPGITYTPAPGKKRMAQQWNVTANKLRRGSPKKNPPSKTYPDFRAGKRGNPDHLADEDYSDPVRMTDYFGTAHEIEAHAAGAASAIIGQLMTDWQERPRWDRGNVEQIVSMNQFIDEAVADIRYGNWSSHYSVQQQVNLMRSQLAQAQARIEDQLQTRGLGEALPKADILHRKVWRLFLTKLIRHLLSHKRPLPDTAYDYQREENPAPRQARVGGITHPAKPPELPR